MHNAQCKPRQPKSDLVSEVRHEDGSVTYTKKIGGENISVTYSKEGYPDFSPYSHPEHSKPVEINMTGNNHKDFKAANQKIGLKGSNPPEGYTWHHLEDGDGMLLVETKVHSRFHHSGGASDLRNRN